MSTNPPHPLRPEEISTIRVLFDRESQYRPHWPQDFDQATRDPLTLAILRTMAAHPGAQGYGRRLAPGHAPRGLSMPRQRELEALPPDPIDPDPTGQRARAAARAQSIDWKSRAAGEKPD